MNFRSKMVGKLCNVEYDSLLINFLTNSIENGTKETIICLSGIICFEGLQKTENVVEWSKTQAWDTGKEV